MVSGESSDWKCWLCSPFALFRSIGWALLTGFLGDGISSPPLCFLLIRVESQTLADVKTASYAAQTGQMVLAALAMDQGRSRGSCPAELKGLWAEDPLK